MLARLKESELIAITDRSAAGIIDDDVLNQAIDDAESEVDSYLEQRYQTPVSPSPGILSERCVDITRYRLHVTTDAAVQEDVRLAYEDARAWLVAIRDNRQSLPGVTDRDSGGSLAVGTRREPVFSDVCMGKMPGVTCS